MTPLTIQLVGWNHRPQLEAGLKALAALPVDEVITRYLDNGSTDGSAELVKRLLPRVEIIELGRNTGFAYAHNDGFRRTTTPYILIHNPDLVIDWDGIKKLLHAFTDPTVGAVQGKIMRSQTSDIIDSAGIILTKALNGVDRGAGKIDRGQYEVQVDVAAATGACALYRMTALKAVEYFDEDFFSYKEDVDLGWRMQKAHWRSVYVPIIAGYHHRYLKAWRLSNFYARLKDPRTRYSLRNWVWMVAKNVSFTQELKAEPFIIGRLVVWLGLSFLYPPLFKAWREILQSWPRMVAKRS